ncbi:Uncharacterised protein [Mycobacteroides abscessus subsp. abscessus]|uniref:hypothetical protein n=1 Tax=Mycobacteroides abscessus TaxID=36809 RepID=UPI000925B801|nr:hypothetical protein [Mycobacteroides abscessus]SIC62154.1 Uncharacterised protein [Mycobacteroides abscessus subsp. abscessus]SIC93721.1 Uncharacterised protein [Mycobacteroides abscessus subsp. abscessus]SID22932.1 Uncharacterised protein [Mycobacteroides abscessus subsp. abscessus]SID51352.1 Uncharacterised protein [Mycobacteroides abscessus subsp. abscessus]SKT56937.1 Uncharacterised protein [Mycobacteroides abscessus subsp. abscessus]
MITTTLLAATDYMAAPFWEIGANIKNRGIETAVYVLFGGTAVVSVITFLVAKNKTHALKVAAFGILLAGIIGALPSLGIVSKDSVNGLTNTTSYR